MLAVGLTLGLLLSLAWQSPAGGSIRESIPQPARVWLSIERLEAEQRKLKATLVELRQELSRRQQAAAASTDRLEALKAELERQRFLAGLTSVRGPGVLVVLDDSQAHIPSRADANRYIIHEYDLRDVVNLMWMAGSEAIAVNDERLVSSTSIYCLGSTVMVNDTRLSPPYQVRAIGNPRVQQEYLRNPSYLQELKTKQRVYSLRFEVKGVSDMVLPAYNGGFLIQHARPGE
jgi:uncharacterized protein YlxW (UPF0749 family)